MPLDLLLRHAGDYEKTHQVALHVLMTQSDLATELGLPRVSEVEWEYERGLFDLLLQHEGNEATGVEIKTWAEVRDDQAERQRSWANARGRTLVYVLLGSAEFEGVPDEPLRNERHVGAGVLRDAVVRAGRRTDCAAPVRGLAEGYARWLDAHIRDRAARTSAPVEAWGRLEHAVFYDRIRASLGWTAWIYPSNNRGGPVYILNFDHWKELRDRRAGGAKLYWELVNGTACFKFGPVPEHARKSSALSIRQELRDLVVRSARRHGLEVISSGRPGEYMSIARATLDLRTCYAAGVLDQPRVRGHLSKCRKVHEAVVRAWAARS